MHSRLRDHSASALDPVRSPAWRSGADRRLLEMDSVVLSYEPDDGNGHLRRDLQVSSNAYSYMYSQFEVAKLTASDAYTNDYFGYSVAISGDTVVVGAYKENSGRGAAYIFRITDGGATYSQVAKLTASGSAYNDYFGYSVAIEGSTVVVGAYNKNDGCAQWGDPYTGVVFIFRSTDGGNTYAQVAKLKPTDCNQCRYDMYFGKSVAIYGDTVVIGAPADTVSGSCTWPASQYSSNEGSTYVFRTSDGGATYGQVAKLIASDKGYGDYFGNSLAISGDTVVIGAYGDYYSRGAAYVFRTTNGGATYAQIAKLMAADAAVGDNFGYSVAIDGSTVVVGAYLGDDAGSMRRW